LLHSHPIKVSNDFDKVIWCIIYTRNISKLVILKKEKINRKKKAKEKKPMTVGPISRPLLYDLTVHLQQAAAAAANPLPPTTPPQTLSLP
jgi:hypothetical protein